MELYGVLLSMLSKLDSFPWRHLEGVALILLSLRVTRQRAEAQCPKFSVGEGLGGGSLPAS